MDTDEALRMLVSDPGRTGIFTDFDGTLSEIVDRPEDARPVPGAVEVLEALARSFGLVAIVSGRSLEDLRDRLAPSGVIIAGSYGRERSDRPGPRRSVEGWESVAVAAGSMIASLPGIVLERKGAGIALHFRAAPQLEAEVRRAAVALAEEFGLQVLPGRLVVELVRPGPGKGDAIAALAGEWDLDALLVAGDDVADLEAFEWAREAPVRSVVVGVSSEEAPPSLPALADVVVPGPAALLALFRRLSEAV